MIYMAMRDLLFTGNEGLFMSSRMARDKLSQKISKLHRQIEDLSGLCPPFYSCKVLSSAVRPPKLLAPGEHVLPFYFLSTFFPALNQFPFQEKEKRE